MNDDESFAAKGSRIGLRFPVSVITQGAIAEHAKKVETRQKLLSAIERMERDEILQWRLEFLQRGLSKLGAAFDYQDPATIAHSFADLATPRTMLEICSVRSYAAVLAACANSRLDLCLIDHGRAYDHDVDSSIPKLLTRQLQSVGHDGKVNFYSGSSRDNLSKVFLDHPATTFDLVVIDGDHTADGANEDLRDLFPRVSPGGVLIFDNIAHPDLPGLLELWHKWRKTLDLDFRFGEYLDHGHGVGWAVRSYERIQTRHRPERLIVWLVRKLLAYLGN